MIKCDPRAKARCPYKGMCGRNDDFYFNDGSECDIFNQKIITSYTNADHIRAMSDEKLAVMLKCPNEMGMAEIPCDHSDDKNCRKCLLAWLKQPAGEE